MKLISDLDLFLFMFCFVFTKFLYSKKSKLDLLSFKKNNRKSILPLFTKQFQTFDTSSHQIVALQAGHYVACNLAMSVR